jgi:N-dimethylarginine dimethylaminohydrolase
MQAYGGQSMVRPLRRALVFPPVPPDDTVSWQAFGYLRPIDHARAVVEHAAFRQLLATEGVELIVGEIDDPGLQDAIFPFDPLLLTDHGAVLCRMGKPLRAREVALAEKVMTELGIPIIGRIREPGTLEGGDCLWLDERTLVVGRGYRTNSEGIQQLRQIVQPLGVTVITVDLPHWRGPGEVLHLLSLVSLVDDDLAVVYLPLLAVEFVRLLRDRGIESVPVPDEEFPTQGPNVLALGPRRCLLLEENRQTIRRLEAAGCTVLTYAGHEISHNRSGGPTCLTRPLLRTEG